MIPPDPAAAPPASNPIRFDDRVVVITGAGRGIGRDNAIQFAARGALVVVNDNGGPSDGYGDDDPAPAHEVVAAIHAAGGTAIADVNDISEEAGAAALVNRAIDEYGRIDVVVNNAGIACLTPAGIEATTLESFRHYARYNLESAFLVTRQAWPHLVASGQGRVILATSTAGYFGFPDQLPYNSSKMGMVGLIRSLAVEGAPVGILVNGVAPSAYTRLTEQVASRSPNPIMQEWLRASLPVEYITPVVLWLGSQECTVTGHDYDVAGGRVSRLLITAETTGVVARALTPEAVRDRLDEIHALEDIVVIKQGRNHLGMLRSLLAPPAAATE
ncbi:MAG: short-chain dehydrogenase/reductase [Acidimicrobiia bacterium]|nr:short-chain dehydrogenase/reductase [Acidimicrobiia bacterium]